MLGSQSIWKILIYLFLLSITFCCAATNAADYYEVIPSDDSTYQSTPFYDYDYGTEVKSAVISPSTVGKTTQRPLVTAWQKLVRNVRRNIPAITWNVTNPLTNLFNDGSSNVLEPPNTANSDRKKKRKNSTSTKNNKNNQPIQMLHLVEISEQKEEDESTQGDEDMFFLDPITQEYYVVKRISSSSSSSLKPNKVQVPTESVNIIEDISSGSSNLKPNIVQVAPEGVNIVEHASSSLKPIKVQLTTETIPIEEPVAVQTLEEELTQPDEDVQVVEVLEDTPDDLPMEPEKMAPMVITNEDNKDSILRNYIGSYMRADQLSRRRQQAAYQKREKLSRQRPRKILYILRGW